MAFKYANLELHFHKRRGKQCARLHQAKPGHMPTLLKKPEAQQQSELPEVPAPIMQSCWLFLATEL
jgi:hypothetical protein